MIAVKVTYAQKDTKYFSVSSEQFNICKANQLKAEKEGRKPYIKIEKVTK